MGVLGEQVAAPQAYSPEILEAIPRELGRAALGVEPNAVFHGGDAWHLYEVSWLNSQERPQHRVGVLTIPASSPNTVESKSLKLYLNSLNFHEFVSDEHAEHRICADLEAVVGSAVSLVLMGANELSAITVKGPIELLEHTVSAPLSGPSDLSELIDSASGTVQLRLGSHHLRSLCPVTGQPDWATWVMDYRGPAINREVLLAYIESFREHQEYHEQCVERQFTEILKASGAEYLSIGAFYQRRGGIDITPWRSTEVFMPPLDRLDRQ